ncbi:MAG: hypothetical protein OEU76_09100, partial [Cyclobacteriaceae bacterium]|nr:hypothetical protein [Cyclobacteriaceae bacterium]
MDSTSSGLDFAVIGHQDNWHNISAFINDIRVGEQDKLSLEKIRNIFSFIPPRDLFRVRFKSKTGTEVNGVYIDTFIDPDKLDAQFIRINVDKVKSAISHAKKLGARIVALGGFTSIVLEGNLHSFSTGETKFTTGNSLTAAYIVKGIERAAFRKDIDLRESSILIVGASGDIGTACISYLKAKVKKILLCARNKYRLEKLSQELEKEDISVKYSLNMQDLIPEADVIIGVASSTGMELTNCKRG